MRKVHCVLLCILLLLSVSFTGCGDKDDGGVMPASRNSAFRVAILSSSEYCISQNVYDCLSRYCIKNTIEYYCYYSYNNAYSEQIKVIKRAVSDGYNVIIIPGTEFIAAVLSVCGDYPNVRFALIDVTRYDVVNAFPEEDIAESNIDDIIPQNVFCASFSVEISGYMAGYSAVKAGYYKLAFIGSEEKPDIMLCGYGFLRGADAAARELDITEKVSCVYAYSNSELGNNKISVFTDKLINYNDAELIFAYGGFIYSSVCEVASEHNNVKIIADGADVPAVINQYKSGLCFTCTVKDYYAVMAVILGDIAQDNGWDKYAGKFPELGLTSAEDDSNNFVHLSSGATLWNDLYSKDAYLSLTEKIYDGEISVSDDISVFPETAVKVEYIAEIY